MTQQMRPPGCSQSETDRGARARAKAANRKTILDAAKRAFAEIGYENATVRDVIRRSNLAAGTFYNYFRSKEELFVALTTDFLQRFRPLLDEAKQESASIDDYIERAFLLYFQFSLEEANAYAQPLLSNAPTLGAVSLPSDVDIVFDEVMRQFESYLKKHNLEGIDTIWMTASCIGIAREMRARLLKQENPAPKEAARFARTIFLNGFAGIKNEVVAR